MSITLKRNSLTSRSVARHVDSIVGNTRSLLYIGLLWIISLLPLPHSYRLACLLGRIRYRFWGIEREWRASLIEIRLGVTPGQAERWLRRSAELTVCDHLDCWIIPRLRKEHLRRLIRIDGLENLNEALERGRGVVLYSAHMKGARASVVALGLLGYRLTLLRGPRDSGRQNAVTRWFNGRYRRTMTNKLKCRYLVVDRRHDPALGVECVRALRRNEIVGIRADRRHPAPEDLPVRFLNEETRLPPGAPLLARSSGAPLIHLGVRYSTDLLPIICTIGPPEYVAGDLQAAVQLEATRMEASIQEDPAGWNGWLA